MSTAKLKLVQPQAAYCTADDHYPRHVVIPGVLAFCLTAWALVILAVTHLGA